MIYKNHSEFRGNHVTHKNTLPEKEQQRRLVFECELNCLLTHNTAVRAQTKISETHLTTNVHSYNPDTRPGVNRAVKNCPVWHEQWIYKFLIETHSGSAFLQRAK